MLCLSGVELIILLECPCLLKHRQTSWSFYVKTCYKAFTLPVLPVSSQKYALNSRQISFCHFIFCFSLSNVVIRSVPTVQADSQGHVSHYHELMSRVWPVNAYFLLLSLAENGSLRHWPGRKYTRRRRSQTVP